MLKKRRVSLQTLLQLQVRSNAKVLVVGPGGHNYDRSTFLLNKIARRGKLVVLDVPDLEKYMKAKRVPKHEMSVGGLKQFKLHWPSDKARLPMLAGGTAGQMPLKSEKFDVVYDHFTLNFTSLAHSKNQVLSEYLRVLKPGGKIILAGSRAMEPYYKNEIKQLPNVKTTSISVHEQPEPPEFRLPVHQAEVAWIIRKVKKHA